MKDYNLESKRNKWKEKKYIVMNVKRMKMKTLNRYALKLRKVKDVINMDEGSMIL